MKDIVFGKLIGNLMDCKAAGGSGWRNSRTKAIASTPDGLRVLTVWVRVCITAKVPEHMAHAWRGVLGIPLRKGVDGCEVRPILIGESLMSLPGAYLQFATQSKVGKLLSGTQFGIGVTAGAETMLSRKNDDEIMPRRRFRGTRYGYAFGEVSRAEVLVEVISELPEIAPFLIQLWGIRGTPISIASDCSSWAVILLIDGLFQGHNLSSLLFCLALRRAMKRFTQACDVQSDVIGKVIRIEYIDDLVLKIRASVVHVVIPLLEVASASVNLKLGQSKSKVLIPSARLGETNVSIQHSGLVQVHGTLELLGGSLDGEYSIEVSLQGTPLPSASIKRLDKAEKRAESIGALLSSALSRPSYRAAWTLIDKVLNKALDYDARILSPESFSDVALRLDHAVRKSLTKIVNVAHLIEAEYESMTLESTRGGCGITPAALKASLAPVAASCQVLPLVGQTLLDMGWMKQEIENSISFEGIHQCFDLLRGRGIFLGVDGSVHDELPAHPMTGLCILWGHARKMYGVIYRKLQHHVELDLRDRYVGTPRNLARLNSCSGNVFSKWLQSFPSS